MEGFSFHSGNYQIKTLKLAIEGNDLKISIPAAKMLSTKEDRKKKETLVEASIGNSNEVTVKWLKKTTFTSATITKDATPVHSATDSTTPSVRRIHHKHLRKRQSTENLSLLQPYVQRRLLMRLN